MKYRISQRIQLMPAITATVAFAFCYPVIFKWVTTMPAFFIATIFFLKCVVQARVIGSVSIIEIFYRIFLGYIHTII